MESYYITLEVVSTSESMAYQILAIALKEKWKKKRGEGIREPKDFREIAGARWRMRD